MFIVVSAARGADVRLHFPVAVLRGADVRLHFPAAVLRGADVRLHLPAAGLRGANVRLHLRFSVRRRPSAVFWVGLRPTIFTLGRPRASSALPSLNQRVRHAHYYLTLLFHCLYAGSTMWGTSGAFLYAGSTMWGTSRAFLYAGSAMWGT